MRTTWPSVWAPREPSQEQRDKPPLGADCAEAIGQCAVWKSLQQRRRPTGHSPASTTELLHSAPGQPQSPSQEIPFSPRCAREGLH